MCLCAKTWFAVVISMLALFLIICIIGLCKRSHTDLAKNKCCALYSMRGRRTLLFIYTICTNDAFFLLSTFITAFTSFLRMVNASYCSAFSVSQIPKKRVSSLLFLGLIFSLHHPTT